jgi:ribose transport system ATP-binding protein
MTAPAAPLVEMTGISKEFGGFRALDGVDFRLEHGEVHALFGENGAGKSTLISILSGVFQPTSGRISFNGNDVEIRSVHDAASLGISTVFQEFSLVPTLRVYENIYLGREVKRGILIDRGAMQKGARELCERLGFEIDVMRRAIDLSRAEQQMVEIAKAFLTDLRVLILDEPTASLTHRETLKLFQFIENIKARGVGIVYISHRIQELSAMADQITVLRDGRKIATVPAKGTADATLIELMTGRAINKIYPDVRRQPNGAAILSIRGLRARGVDGIDIEVRAGEILGCAGLVGSGKSRTWRTVMGLQPTQAGAVRLKDHDLTRASTRQMLAAGIFYLPPDRKAEGLQLPASARENIRLSVLNRPGIVGGFGVVAGRARTLATEIGRRVTVSENNLEKIVSMLSGGNQQKVLFGKGFGAERELYIFDEPTVGVDMGTRVALYNIIKDIAESGKAIVIISSDLPEVMRLAHRLLVFSKGRVVAEMDQKDISEASVLKCFFDEAKEVA